MTAIAVAASLLPLSADGLPELPKASEITEGFLPDGIRFYVVANPSEKGFADFSLVQRDFAFPEQARRNLVSLAHFGSRRPCDFLQSHGVSCSREGYVGYRYGHTVYSFRSVPTSSRAVTDSTLLMLMDIASTCPGAQAVVISGDVTAVGIKDRLDLLSLLVSQRSRDVPADKYEWRPTDSPSIYYSASHAEGLAAIRVSYSSKRTPREMMNTVQPVVVRRYATYLGHMLNGRISKAFKDAGIPLADIEYRYRDSSDGQGDEMYTFTVTTSSDRYRDAIRILSAILADLDTRGATEGEFKDAKISLVAKARREFSNTRYTNAQYVERCVNAYLYGASLAGEDTFNQVFTKSTLPIEQELPLFNGFVSAPLDSRQNLILGFDTPGASVMPELGDLFASSWAEAVADRSKVPEVPPALDTLRPVPSRSRLRVSSESAETVSGGTLFTLSNGMRVIYKKTDLSGEFHYAFMIRGGAALMENLSPGEYPFVGDMLELCDVAGYNGTSFKKMLSDQGITMNTSVSLSDLRITGEAPKNGLELLLNALNSLAKVKSIDTQAFEYYKKCEAVRIKRRRYEEKGIRDVVDSLIAPGYEYTGLRSISALSKDFPIRAIDFYSSQFSRFADGVICFMGDLDLELLKKQLCQYFGDFETSKAASSRPRISGRSLVGKETKRRPFYGNASGPCTVAIARAGSLNVNVTNMAAFRVGCLVLRKRLAEVLPPMGYTFTVDSDTELFPQECITLYVQCNPCSVSGLPEGIEPASPEDVAAKVNEVLSSLSSVLPDIAPFKTVALAQMNGELADTGARMALVLTRYSEGKDLVSGYDRSVNALTDTQVRSIFSTLSSGRHIQYIVK